MKTKRSSVLLWRRLFPSLPSTGWLLALSSLLPLTASLGAAERSKAEVFKLREVSAFDQPGSGFLRGQNANCGVKPEAKVKAYPAFKSAKPIYGSVRFAAEKGEAESGRLVFFAVDESGGTGKGYDRFYCDLDGDLDLRNDAVLMPQRRPPAGAEMTYGGIKQQVIFDFISPSFDFGPAGKLPVQLMPRLLITVYEKEEYQQVSFVRTRLYQGVVKVGGREFLVRLGNDYFISGRLDSPGTALVFSPKDEPGREVFSWWGGDRLTAAHKIGSDFYTFSTTPTGSELTISRYAGELGRFELGAGNRRLDKLTMNGALDGQEHGVPVGAFSAEGAPTGVRGCELPVGDYRPNLLGAQFGRLRISMSYNYHSDGKPRDRGDRAPVYGIHIRKDKPFVLDFANKPEVVFASPTKTQRLKPGDSLEVKAVLVDPQLDTMIRNLDDTTRTQTKDAGGRDLGYARNLSLDPKVTITRANGEKVAEGVMPFG